MLHSASGTAGKSLAAVVGLGVAIPLTTSGVSLLPSGSLHSFALLANQSKVAPILPPRGSGIWQDVDHEADLLQQTARDALMLQKLCFELAPRGPGGRYNRTREWMLYRESRCSVATTGHGF